MSPSSPQHEPTMEEILASIRKIISEDTPDAQPAPAASVDAKPAPDGDVLELTEEVHEEPVPAPPPPASVASVAFDEHPAPATDDVVFQPIEEPPVSAQPSTPSGDGIFSEKTRKALNDAFSNVEPEAEARPQIGSTAPVAPVDGRTIESVFDQAVRSTFDPVLHSWLESNKDVIVERMKPVITQWLDEHFPAMLEEAVREELARVSKSRVKR